MVWVIQTAGVFRARHTSPPSLYHLAILRVAGIRMGHWRDLMGWIGKIEDTTCHQVLQSHPVYVLTRVVTPTTLTLKTTSKQTPSRKYVP